MTELEGRCLGSCRLLRLLGAGGMGAVYLARDQHLDREVAVKVISSDLARDKAWLARFRREAVAQARLSHPSLVAIHSFSMEADLPFLVMEYVRGSSLRDLLRERGALPPAQALAWIAQILEGLACAHEHGVLHRDIKPGNILVGVDGRVKLGDFGIAKVHGGEELTRVGEVLGTPLYAPPEQIRGATVGPEGDLYALGVTLFEMVVGRLPFRGADTPGGDVRLAHLHTPPPLPSSLRSDLPAALDDLLLRCLAKEAGERFPGARAMLRAVKDPRLLVPGKRIFPAWGARRRASLLWRELGRLGPGLWRKLGSLLGGRGLLWGGGSGRLDVPGRRHLGLLLVLPLLLVLLLLVLGT